MSPEGVVCKHMSGSEDNTQLICLPPALQKPHQLLCGLPRSKLAAKSNSSKQGFILHSTVRNNLEQTVLPEKDYS